MTDLRAALIEAIEPFACHSVHAPQAVDAFLDTLADRADEWDRLATTTFDDYPALRAKSFTHNLVAVLREGDEQ